MFGISRGASLPGLFRASSDAGEDHVVEPS
jgi:hypothetical protein